MRDRNGSEAQKEKNQRKADKLVAEVYALKTIKDDEISKFGIMNEKNVKDILQSQSSSSRDRAIARVVGYKSFNRRLMQFRDRFPDYKMYLSEEKKKCAKTKRKSSARSKKPLVEDKRSRSQREDSKEPNANSNEIAEDSLQRNSSNEEIDKTKNNSRKRRKPSKEDVTDSIDKKLAKPAEDNALEDVHKPTAVKLCSVTKEAAVKRFAELLEEQDSTGDAQTSAASADHERAAAVQAKSGDDFFMTGSDEEGYQENLSKASTSYIKFDTSSRTLRSSHRIKTQNSRSKNLYRDDTRESKTRKYDQSKRQQPKGKKVTKHDKYSDEQSPATRQERRGSKVNKSTNKNNLNTDDKDKTNLHPSWLAKKKQQDVMKQGFQGKKIVFADD